MSTPPPPPPPTSPPPPPPGGGFASPNPVLGGRALPSPWKRIGARFLDGLILFVINFVIIYQIVVGDVGGFQQIDDVSSGKLFLASLIGVAISFVYDAVLTKLKGGTPMKLAFGMRVVQAESGAPVEWQHAIIRWAVPGALALIAFGALATLVNVVSFVIVVVSLVFLFTKPLRQAVWDLAAKTVVVEH